MGQQGSGPSTCPGWDFQPRWLARRCHGGRATPLPGHVCRTVQMTLVTWRAYRPDWLTPLLIRAWAPLQERLIQSAYGREPDRLLGPLFGGHVALERRVLDSTSLTADQPGLEKCGRYYSAPTCRRGSSGEASKDAAPSRFISPVRRARLQATAAAPHAVPMLPGAAGLSSDTTPNAADARAGSTGVRAGRVAGWRPAGLAGRW